MGEDLEKDKIEDSKPEPILNIIDNFHYISACFLSAYFTLKEITEFLSNSYNKSKFGLFNFFQNFSLIVICAILFFVIFKETIRRYKATSQKNLHPKLEGLHEVLKHPKARFFAKFFFITAVLIYFTCMGFNLYWNSQQWVLKTSWANAANKEKYISIMKEDLENFKNDVWKATNGEIKIKIDGGEAEDQAILFDQLKKGDDLQMLYSVQYYWPGDIQDSTARAGDFFAAVPFGSEFEEMNDWIEKGGGQELWDEFCKKINVKPFAFGNSGKQYGGWFKDSLNFRNDTLRVGKKPIFMRIPTLQGEVIKELNGQTTNVMAGEITKKLDEYPFLNGV